MRQEPIELYYREPRLEMTTIGRFFVRLALYAGYAISAATAVTLLLQHVRYASSSME